VSRDPSDNPELAIPEPEVRRLDGVVREVSVPPMVYAVTHGSLADIPFDNAAGPRPPGPQQAGRGRELEDVTAAEFAEQVQAVAKGLIAEGLLPGDRIAIMARTTYEWTLLDFAAWAAGLVTVPVYPTSSLFQIRWILQDSGAVAIAVETVAQAAALGPERPGSPTCATCGSSRRGTWSGSPSWAVTCRTRKSPYGVGCCCPTRSPRSSTPRAPRAAPRAAR
jgi:long-chain acyl-CoA synthetase